jgi:hypothetical protein
VAPHELPLAASCYPRYAAIASCNCKLQVQAASASCNCKQHLQSATAGCNCKLQLQTAIASSNYKLQLHAAMAHSNCKLQLQAAMASSNCKLQAAIASKALQRCSRLGCSAQLQLRPRARAALQIARLQCRAAAMHPAPGCRLHGAPGLPAAMPAAGGRGGKNNGEGRRLLQGCRLQGCRAAGPALQRCSAAKLPRCMAAGLQGQRCGAAALQGCSAATLPGGGGTFWAEFAAGLQ